MISSNFDTEQNLIKEKFTCAGYPLRFTESIIRQFHERQREKEEIDEYIIPPNFFDIPKPYVQIELPFCHKNEEVSKFFPYKVSRIYKPLFLCFN